MALGGLTAVALAATAAASTDPVPTPRLDAATNRAIAERAAVLLETRYVMPRRGRQYAAALRWHALHGGYDRQKDAATLAARLTADVQAVAPDGHLRFYRIEPEAQPAPDSPAPPADSGDRRTAPGIREMTWVAPQVAYLSFEHFDDRPEAMDAVAEFLRDYAGADALIIDARGNHGGAFDMMGVLANHLFPAPRHLADMDMASAVVAEHGSPFPVDGQILRRGKGPPGMDRFEHWAVPATDNDAWFRVPVYYLTSRETFSAAEHFAMILKTTGRGRLIGEPTGGGNHFGGTEPVGGGLELFVPVGHTTDPVTGRDWESTGVVPDVAVPAAEALTEALRRVEADRHIR